MKKHVESSMKKINKNNLTRAMLLLLLFALALPFFAGCKGGDVPTTPEEQTPAGSTPPAGETPTTEEQNPAPEDPEQRFLNGLASAAGDNAESFEVRPCYQSPVISSWSPFTVAVKDEGVYMNQYLYDEISYSEDVQIVFGDIFDAYAAEGYFEAEIVETVEKLSAQQGCLVLSRNSEPLKGKIAVYEMDGFYYFVSFFDGEQLVVSEIRTNRA